MADRHPLDGVRARNTVREHSMPPLDTKRFSLTPRERPDYGVIVTVQHSTSGAMQTVSEVGGAGKALKRVVEGIDILNGRDDEGRWEIISISTPATIFADLQGGRDELQPGPEQLLLARLHRLDLLKEQPYVARTNALWGWSPRRKAARQTR